MIKIIKFNKEVKYEEYTKYTSLLDNKEDHIIFDMMKTEYIPASMIGFLMMLKQKRIHFDLVLSSQVEYILRIKNIYNYLTGGFYE
jgi:hypothetical protein